MILKGTFGVDTVRAIMGLISLSCQAEHSKNLQNETLLQQLQQSFTQMPSQNCPVVFNLEEISKC